MKSEDGKHLTKIIAEIERTILSLKLEFQNVKLSPGFDLSTDTSKIAEEVDHSLKLLHAKARLGDTVAIAAIHSIGIDAANFITELGSSPEEQKENLDAFPPRYRVPAIFLTCDDEMLSIQAILEREKAFIFSLSPESIRAGFCEKIDYDYDIHLICSKLISRNSVKDFKDPTTRLGPDEISRNRVSMNVFRDMINALIRTLYQKESRSIVQGRMDHLATQSLHWPIVGHAWQDSWKNLSQQMQDLDLGKDLPFAVRKNSAKGKSRDLGHGSSTLYVLSLCSHLSKQKAIFPEVSNKLWQELSKIDIWLDELLRNHLRSKKSKGITINEREYRWDLNSHWELKAVLLPEFPKCGEAGIASQMQWKEALLLLAENHCQGDWEGYPWWPSSVHQRGKFDKVSQRNRTKREAVAEFIASGMKNLVQRPG